MSTPAQDPLDRAMLEELREILSDAGLAELIDLYLEEAPRSIEALTAAIAAGDAARVRAAAHRLKGAAAGIGALEVTALARLCEQAAEAGEVAAVEQQLTALREAADVAAALLRALLP